MSDTQLTQLLINLAEAIRDEPQDQAQQALGDRFFAVVAHLESPGDVVVAFSDGVSEAMNEADEEYTDERLIAAVDAHRGLPPQALLEALLADVRQFCGRATPNDDVTMVVMRYDG